MTAGAIGLVPIGGDVGKGIAAGQLALKHIAKLKGYVPDDALKYQHAFVDCGDGTIVEAEPGGAVRVANHYPADETLWLDRPEMLQSTRDTIVHYAQTFVEANGGKGVPYSFLDYGAISLHALGVNVNWLQCYIQDSGHLICSQLADLAWSLAHQHIFDDGRWPGFVTPMDLAYVARTSG